MYNSPLNSLSTINDYYNTGKMTELRKEQSAALRNSISDWFIKQLVNINNLNNPDLQFEVSQNGGTSKGQNSSNDQSSSNDVEPIIQSKPSGSSGHGSGSGYGGSSPLNYSDWSPAAKLFGMDRSTAYAEHLANTAHQREVADLKAAGLNPVLGLSSGASIVSGSFDDGSGSGSSSSSSAKKTFFGDIADVVGSIAGLAVNFASKDKKAGAQNADMTAKAISKIGEFLDKTLGSE